MSSSTDFDSVLVAGIGDELGNVPVPIHHSPDPPGLSKRRMKADDVDFNADLDSEFGDDDDDDDNTSIASAKLVTSSPFLLNDRRRTISPRQRTGAVQSISVPLAMAEKQKPSGSTAKSPSSSPKQRIDVIRMKLATSPGAIDHAIAASSGGPAIKDGSSQQVGHADTMTTRDCQNSGHAECSEPSDDNPASTSPSGDESDRTGPFLAGAANEVTSLACQEAEARKTQQEKALCGNMEQECEILDIDSETMDECRDAGLSIPIKEQARSFHNRERECEILDFDSETMDDCRQGGLSTPFQKQSASSQDRERECEILDFDDEFFDDGHAIHNVAQATLPLHRQKPRVCKEREGELLGLDSDTLGGETQQDSPCKWVEPPKIERKGSENSIIDLEDSETPIGAESGEGDLLDMEADMSLGPSTIQTPLECERGIQQQDLSQQDTTPEAEKLVELRRKQEHDARQTRAGLAQQNDRIAAKLMGESGPASQSDKDVETKLGAQRGANGSDGVNRQAALANHNEQIASKMTGTGQPDEKVLQSSSERQAALADATHLAAVKMTAALPNTTNVDDSPTETDAAVNAPAELDIERGESKTNVVVAKPVDVYLPSALEYDHSAKPKLIRNRRFRLYASLTVFVIAVGTVALSLGIKWARWEYQGIPFRRTLGIRETLEATLGHGSFLDASSHHSAALRWITHHDKLRIRPDDEHFFQRFLAASFYFATTATSDWESPCAPSSQYEAPNECEVTTLVAPGHEVSTLGMRWLSGEHECSWFGVQCDELQQIRSIETNNMNITGSLPANIHSFFPSLQNLRLQDNLLEGSLSGELFSSSRHLAEINLGNNRFSGTLPDSLYHSQTLQRVFLGGNNLEGALSSSIEYSRTMKFFGLSGNRLNGTVPKEFALHHSWFVAELRDNQLEGTLPDDIGGLRVLDVHGNLLSGTIPVTWENATDLQEVSVGQNNLVGHLPQLASLHVLDVEGNQLVGTLPAFGPEFLYINIANNEFSGTIPAQWASLPRLLFARLDNNNLNGTMPLCSAGRAAQNVSDLTLATATCNEDLECECCDTSCLPLLVRENGDPLANGPGR